MTTLPGFPDAPALQPQLAWAVVLVNLMVIAALIAALAN
jgi:hypothetical protein